MTVANAVPPLPAKLEPLDATAANAVLLPDVTKSSNRSAWTSTVKSAGNELLIKTRQGQENELLFGGGKFKINVLLFSLSFSCFPYQSLELQ